MRPSAHAAVLSLVALLASAAPPEAAADDVYLTNGQVFEGVVARRDGDMVRIRMGHGEMGLPASWVERIDEGDSVLEEFLARRAALEPAGTASGWLDLALWARGHGFAEGAREAGLRAAALDPRLDGLAPVLQAAGYTFDGESGEWLTEARLMARRGFVRVGDEWLPASVVAERERAAREARADSERQAREERLERAITLLALSQLEEQAEGAAAPAETAPAVLGAYAGYGPFAAYPGTVVHVPRGHHHPGGHDRRGDLDRRRDPPPIHPPADDHRGSFGYDALAGRQPGSIIPIAVDPGAARVSARPDGRD